VQCIYRRQAEDQSKMKCPVSGIILAGGENKRYGGRPKAFITIQGRCILDHIYGLFHALFDEIILVTNNPEAFLRWDLNIVTDLFAVRSSLTGIHAGLYYATHPHVFVAACDTPFLRKELVSSLLDRVEPELDIVIPRTDAGFEPLCAVYSKKCMASMEQQLLKKQLKIETLFKKVRVKEVREPVLRQFDPQLHSFFNINSPEDLARAKSLSTNA
jgi:molybdopterin-guanine dinucleotide biosynthesis protein A